MTNKNNTNNTPTTNSVKWDIDQIFESNFIFPTEHFNDLDELNAIDEEVFSNMMIAMIELLPPLSDTEQQGLKQAVLSGNRLRTYYLILKMADHYADCLAETQDYNETPSTASSLEHRGYQIVKPEAL